MAAAGTWANYLYENVVDYEDAEATPGTLSPQACIVWINGLNTYVSQGPSSVPKSSTELPGSGILETYGVDPKTKQPLSKTNNTNPDDKSDPLWDKCYKEPGYTHVLDKGGENEQTIENIDELCTITEGMCYDAAMGHKWSKNGVWIGGELHKTTRRVVEDFPNDSNKKIIASPLVQKSDSKQGWVLVGCDDPSGSINHCLLVKFDDASGYSCNNMMNLALKCYQKLCTDGFPYA